MIFLSDPYSVDGAISHSNDWLVLLPVFKDGRLIAYTSMFGHQSDIGGKVVGSMPINAHSIYEEGVRIPPVKIWRKGEYNADLMKLVMHQTRKPDWCAADLNALIASCRVAARRVIEMAERFGDDVYVSATQELLARNHRAMKTLLGQAVSEEPVSFEDYICDDGMGFGPYRIRCTMWREGETVVLDFDGTDPQSAASINFYLNENMFKMFFGIYMIMVFDPQILFNDGFYDLIDVRIPEGSLLKPRFPAALSGAPMHWGASSISWAGCWGKDAGISQCGGLLVLSPPVLCRQRHAAGQGAGVVPVVPDRLWRHSRPAAGRWAGRAFAVAGFHQRAQRIPRTLFSDDDRALFDRAGFGRGRAASRRQRHPHDLSLPQRRNDRHPRRSLVRAAMGRERRRSGQAGAQDPGKGRRHHADRGQQGGRPGRGSGRPVAFHHLGRRWLGRSAGARSGAGRQGNRAGAGHAARRARLWRGGRCPWRGGRGRDTGPARGHARAAGGALPVFNTGPGLDALRAACQAETGLPAPIPPVWPQAEAAE
jgi:hypothetical protein